MARLKFWALVLFCLGLSGSPAIGTAAPKPPPQPSANATRVPFAVAPDATSPSIELPFNLPVLVMVSTAIPGRAGSAIAQIYVTASPGGPGLSFPVVVWQGFDLQAPHPSSIPGSPPVSGFGNGTPASPIVTLDGDCIELVVASPTAIAVHNRPVDVSGISCPAQATGDVTLIW